MANPYPVELRALVVRAYESGKGSYPEIAAHFQLGEATVKRWVWLKRDQGHVMPRPRGGGTPSTITALELDRMLQRLGDATAGELTAEFNRGRRGSARVHVSSMKRALHRNGYVVKKRRRPLESLRPDVEEKRKKYLRRVGRIPVDRLVFLDESGMNMSMSRSHAWVKRGQEYVDRVPINWGRRSLTVAGAIRLSGWVVQSTSFEPMNKHRFVRWLKRRLLPRLQHGDVLVMDNLSAHKDGRVTKTCAARGVRVLYLPPYSPDLNPIEPGWALQKKHVRRYAPREPEQLRRVARCARYRVKPHHAAAWFKHSGYPVQPR